MRKLMFMVITVTSFLLLHFNIAIAYEKEINSLSSTMAESIAKAGKKSIAVVDFVDLQGNVTELGRFLAEEFSVAFAGAGKGFEVVERTHLKTILKEHKLGLTGVIDPSTAKKLGQIAGVDALVTGTITPFGDSVRVSVKILDTDTARVIGALSGDIAKTKAIDELLAKGIETQPATPGAPTTATPSPVKAVEIQGFLFELQSCKFSGQTVTCNLFVTSKGNDRELTLSKKNYFFNRETRIFDDSGNEYIAERFQLGNKVGDSVTQLLVSVIPTKLILTFEGISSQPNRFALLEIGCRSGERRSDNFTVQFRNIPVSR